MIGIELAQRRSQARPIGAEVCMEAIRRGGVLLRPLGPVVVWMPPLSITIHGDQLDRLYAVTRALNRSEKVCGPR